MTNRSTPLQNQPRQGLAEQSPLRDDAAPRNGAVPGQQQQFDAQGANRQPSGSGADGSVAQSIREHMPVVDHTGSVIGTVDHVEGGQIKLTRDGHGEHSYIPLDLVLGIESNHVRLRERGDNDFGIESGT